MHYAAILTGESHVLESVAPCLDGEIARMRRIDTVWVLESSNFQSCQSSKEAFSAADALLARIHTIFKIYLSLFAPFKILSMLTLDDDDNVIGRHLRTSVAFNVYSDVGVQELADRVGAMSLGASILSAAIAKPAVAEALTLVQDQAITWPHVYDIIEFLGGPDEIAHGGFALRKVARTFRQTANHYRHLGRSKAYPLPDHPPTLAEARDFSTGILKQWLLQQV